MNTGPDIELKYHQESQKQVSGNCTQMLMYSTGKLTAFKCKQHTGQKGTRRNYMYTKSQEDNATSTLMRTWRQNMKVLMKIMITEMWTPDYTAQKQEIENRVKLE